MNIWKNFMELVAAREILFAIVGRDVRAKYKQAFMGIVWAVLQPLAMMAMFTLVFSLFARIPSEGIPYPLFAYTALLPWGFFSGGITSASTSIVGNTSLITKIRMPTEVFPFGAIMARGVDLGISSTIFFAMMLIYQVPPNIQMFWLLPLLITQLFLMMAISLFLSALAVFYRDITFGIGLFMQMWMFASPVAYPISIVPDRYMWLYMLNPIATIMDGYRRVILHATSPDLGSLSWILLVSVIICILCYKFFKIQEGKFADLI